MSPTTSRRSWRIENPLRSTAFSPAKQGTAATANVARTPRRNQNESKVRICQRPMTNNQPPLLSNDKRFRAQRQIYRSRDAARVIAASDGPSAAQQFFAGIPHDNRMAGKLKHFDVVVIVTHGHDLL